MPWEAWVTLLVVIFLLLGLVRNWLTPDWMVLLALILLVAVGEAFDTDLLPSPRAAVAEFGNSGLITVGALFVVVAGLVQTGAMALVTEPLLGRPRNVLSAQLRLLVPMAGLSAFINNTPVVAMFMPVVDDICKKARISPSKLFLPVAYTATLGGICSLIGTSTNLVVHGLLISANRPSLGLFELAWVGIPCAIVGVIYILLTSRWLLPDRRPAISLSDDPRQYTVEMVVQPGGPLVGRSIEEAGLRHLPGLYLVEIERESRLLPMVSPHERLQSDDRLVFVGILDSVVDLRKMRGLMPATDQVFKLQGSSTERCLVEAVVADRCPLVGKSIRAGRFRSTYNAAVIAVARDGKRIKAKIGDIVLHPGDTLLLEAHQDFVDQQRNSRDFFLVSHVENSAPPRHERGWLALGILGLMIFLATTEIFDMLTSSLVAAALMIVTRCCTGTEARQSIDWSILVVIGGSLGIGSAIETSGIAEAMATQMISLAQNNPWAVLAIVYFVTLVLTELVTNNAAAVLVFPLTMAAVDRMDVNYLPFVVAIMIAASCGFATPFGYQTNLMVYGPGGYRFSDYVRFGVPLDLLMMLVTVAVAPLIWPF